MREWMLEATGRGSISVGFAQLAAGESCEALLARADQDLISQK